MNSIEETPRPLSTLLTELSSLGVSIRREGDRLVIGAPQGALTAPLQEELRKRKPELLDFLARAQEKLPHPNEGASVKPISRNSDLLLSYAQERLWYLEQLTPGTPVHNVPFAFELSGSLNSRALEQAINQIVDRHEPLRTCFQTNKGQVVQVIGAPQTIGLPHTDLTHLTDPEEQSRALKEALTQKIAQPFDITEGPLLSLDLFRMGPEKHVLLVNAHHMVFDGASLSVLLDELSESYEAAVCGRTANLPALPFQYADYASWQRTRSEEESGKSDLEYWEQKLKGGPDVLELKTDKARPPARSSDGAVEKFTLDGTLLQAIETLGTQNQATLFMTLLAAFKLTLYRLTGQPILRVGSPVSGRAPEQTSALIGYFVNTLVLQTDLGEKPSFQEVLARVRQTCLEAFGHQDLPFERLVESLRPARDLSRTPVFQVMFNYIDSSAQRTAVGDLSLTPVPLVAGVARTDIALWAERTERGLEFDLEYSTDLFHRESMLRFFESFETVLRSVTAQPEQSIVHTPILPPLTRAQILRTWNQTEATYPHEATITELFEAEAKRAPEKDALIFENTRLTYKALSERVDAFSNQLSQLGVGRETLVAVYMDRSSDMVVALLGILKAGGAYVPLDPKYPQARVEFILNDSEAEFVCTEAHLVSKLPKSNARQVFIDEPGTVGSTGDIMPASPMAAADGLAYVIYTSGSTGQPKGVEVLHRNVTNFLTSMAKCPGLSEEDRVFAVTTISFDISVLELFLPLVVGGTVVVASNAMLEGPSAMMAAIEDSGTTFMQATPATWRLLVDAGWSGKKGLKAASGGEALSQPLARQLLTKTESLWNLYGPTETTVWSTCHRVVDAEDPIPIGRPIANTAVYLLDKNQQPVPVGIPGELYIGGAGVTRGYRKRPELSSERFVTVALEDGGPKERLYRTGDWARYLADGTIAYEGRLDHQVKVRGFRIELGEIESVLRSHKAIGAAAALIREPRAGDKRIAAYYEPQGDQSLTVTELRTFCRLKLPEYMVPQHFVELNALPLTPNGKINRTALASQYGVGTTAQESFVPPKTKMERLLAELWREALGVEQISLTDNFFTLGGHSLLSMSVLMKLEQATGTRVSPRDIIFQNLGQVAQAIQNKGDDLAPPASHPSAKPLPPPASRGGADAPRGLRRRLLASVRAKLRFP